VSAEAAVAARLAALLRGDAALMGRVNAVFEGPVARATLPFLSIGALGVSDWGTKDRAGAEVLVRVNWTAPDGPGDGLVGARVAAVVAGLRGVSGGWELVAARLVRSRGEHDKAGRWVQGFEIRVRCLVAV
jgi:Protein of unknown function (DUF3168)